MQSVKPWLSHGFMAASYFNGILKSDSLNNKLAMPFRASHKHVNGTHLTEKARAYCFGKDYAELFSMGFFILMLITFFFGELPTIKLLETVHKTVIRITECCLVDDSGTHMIQFRAEILPLSKTNALGLRKRDLCAPKWLSRWSLKCPGEKVKVLWQVLRRMHSNSVDFTWEKVDSLALHLDRVRMLDLLVGSWSAFTDHK